LFYFGEVTYATGIDLTAGSADEVPDGEKKDENARANRFMFVDIGYDPSRDKSVDAPPVEGQLRGKARAEALGQRFHKWYYVIPDSSFTQLHKLPADFWKAKPAAPAP
jgi:hypothetical protein